QLAAVAAAAIAALAGPRACAEASWMVGVRAKPADRSRIAGVAPQRGPRHALRRRQLGGAHGGATRLGVDCPFAGPAAQTPRPGVRPSWAFLRKITLNVPN